MNKETCWEIAQGKKKVAKVRSSSKYDDDMRESIIYYFFNYYFFALLIFFFFFGGLSISSSFFPLFFITLVYGLSSCCQQSVRPWRLRFPTAGASGNELPRELHRDAFFRRSHAGVIPHYAGICIFP